MFHQRGGACGHGDAAFAAEVTQRHEERIHLHGAGLRPGRAVKKTVRLFRGEPHVGARVWVERCFQDAKSHCGMAQYQARGWVAWHHHMALVALAVLFQMQERQSEATGITQLATSDIVELMEWALIKRPSKKELLARIERRHEKRERSARNKRTALRRMQKRAAKSMVET